MPVYPITNREGQEVLVKARDYRQADRFVNQSASKIKPLKADEIVAAFKEGKTIVDATVADD